MKYQTHYIVMLAYILMLQCLTYVHLISAAREGHLLTKNVIAFLLFLALVVIGYFITIIVEKSPPPAGVIAGKLHYHIGWAVLA